MRSLSEAANDHSSSAAIQASARVTVALPAASVACARRIRLPEAGGATSQTSSPRRSVTPEHRFSVPAIRVVSSP